MNINDKIFTVNEINTYISNIIDKSNLNNISLEGEVSNLTKHSTGNYYLTLKDKKSLIQCLMFKVKTQFLKFSLKEGMNIIATGSIKGYPNGGKYSFLINDIRMANTEKGDVFLKYEELKKFYLQKGYFDKSLKQVIPKFPSNIGVITAPTGAAIRDIKSTIDRRYDIANIYLFPCIVQGNNAHADIVNKIKMANSYETKLDVIILGRGGGSFEDLSQFSEPDVIEEIYKSRIPIISAVGHEIDNQLSDFVADRRAETPTAAAEICTPDKQEILKFLKESFFTMKNLIIKRINKYNQILNFYKTNYHLNNLNWIYKEKEQKLLELKKTIINNMNIIYKNKLNNLNNLSKNINLLNPKSILSRGYSIIKSENKLLKTIQNLKLNQELDIILYDGNIKTTIIDIKKEA